MGESARATPGVAGEAERLVFFTDAVVAIAVTLLVLPLLESIPEAVAEHLAASEWLHEHTLQIVAFVVSFSVSVTFWLSHHRLFEHVTYYNKTLFRLGLLWLLPFVFLQLPSAMIYGFSAEPALYLLYIGTMLLIQVLLTSMVYVAYRHPELCEGAPVPRTMVLGGVVQLVLFSLALVLALVVPHLTYFSLFVLMLAPLLMRLLNRGRSHD